MEKNNLKTGSEQGEYAVGDKKPPIEHQFKKGESGNPAGKKKGVKNFATLYQEGLVALAKLNGKEPEELHLEILQQGIKRARKGDFRFYKDTLDRLYGQPVKKTDHTTGGDKIQGNVITFTSFRKDKGEEVEKEDTNNQENNDPANS